MTLKTTYPLAQLLGVVAAAFVTSTASAQTVLIKTEFNEDDQPGFDLWPVPLAGSLMTAQFGAITVDVSTNTSFAHPVDRGSVNGTPPGYTYQHLYEDLLHAFTPTGTLTLDFSGLAPNTHYTFTLYAWDPGASSSHEWTVTGGTGVPSAITVDWSVPLVDNETFALVFDITTTATGTFRVDNTAGLPQSAINGFKLSEVSGPIGTNYCGPAIPNSTGLAGVMSAFGSPVTALNDVTITADQMTADFGYFLNSMTQGLFNPANSNGFLCLGGAIGRYNQPGLVQPGPSFSITLDLNATPTPTAFVAVLPGDTWNFQAWYRDTGSNNFTDGLEILFQ